MKEDRATSETPFNILLIEDNPAHAELVMRGFEDEEVPNKIFHVLDGAEALDFLFHRGAYSDEQRSPRPYFMLMRARQRDGSLDTATERSHRNITRSCGGESVRAFASRKPSGAVASQLRRRERQNIRQR